MIRIGDIEKRINELLKIFKKRAKVIASFLIDEDGFIISSLMDDSLKKDLCSRKILELYTAAELLYKKSDELIDFHKNTELISIGVIDGLLNYGLMIIIKSVQENIIFLTVIPTLLKLEPIIEEFNNVIDELSISLSDNEK